jgi:hypothetical protein
MLAFIFGGCTYLVKEVFSRGLQDRTGDKQIDDVSIFTSLTKKIKETHLDFLFDLNIEVWRGRVMLTGLMDDPIQ